MHKIIFKIQQDHVLQDLEGHCSHAPAELESLDIKRDKQTLEYLKVGFLKILAPHKLMI